MSINSVIRMDEKFVICPFNKSHVISRLRIQYHLVKCKKNYPNTKKIVCPYDATEYIDPNNFMEHLSTCKKNRTLNFTEEYKRKQFELVKHGCVNNYPFNMPSHVEITNEWGSASNESDHSGNNKITRDEQHALKIRRQSSNAVRKACNYIRLVPRPVGRGQVNEALRKYLNRYEPPSSNEDSRRPVLLADGNDHTIYEDAFEDVDHNSVTLPDENVATELVDQNYPVSRADDNDCDIDGFNSIQDNVGGSSEVCSSSADDSSKSADCKVSDDVSVEGILSRNNLKYYKPPFGRGCSELPVAGRGIPLGRGAMLEMCNKMSSLNKFDLVLKQVVDERLLFDGLNNRKPRINEKLRAEKEKEFAFTASDLLVKKSAVISSIKNSAVKTNFSPSSSSFEQISSNLNGEPQDFDSEVSNFQVNKLKPLSRDESEFNSLGKEVSVKNINLKHLKNLTTVTFPRPNGTGRGFVLKSLDGI